MTSLATTLTVEAIQKTSSRTDKTFLKTQIKSFLVQKSDVYVLNNVYLNSKDFMSESVLFDHIESLTIEPEMPHISEAVCLSDANLIIRVFKLDTTGCQVEELIENDGKEGISAANNYLLPSIEFHGLWESLIYDDLIKDKLLRYVETAMLLSDSCIDSRLISWNKVVLLHGPPGTGKTSLCKALAQKLSIRLSDRFDYAQLVEINSHSLFSRWFSESGKLVQKMFEMIIEMVENPRSFVCVLIDEVESLSTARKSSQSEPSDAIRVVNALLTQIDAIKDYPNVLVLTTSNITGTIDLAFVDRADIKHFIGNPSPRAIYGMLYGSLDELNKKRLIYTCDLILPSSIAQEFGDTEAMASDDSEGSATRYLVQICKSCAGFSGRTIRKLPFLALTKFYQYPVSLNEYVIALGQAVEEAKKDLEKMA